MSKKAVILHTIADAKHCVKNGLYKEGMLFSTNSAVDIYLREDHGIDCKCLSAYLTDDETLKIRDAASDAVDRLLESLDAKISARINAKFGFRLKYFRVLYSYLGKHQITGYIYFESAIRKILDKFKFDKIVLYDRTFNLLISDTTTDIACFMSSAFPGLPVEILDSGDRKTFAKAIIALIARLRWKRIAKKLYEVCCETRDRFKFGRFLKDRKTLLLYEPLYDLQFLKKKLRPYNVLYYKLQSNAPLGFRRKPLDIDFADPDTAVAHNTPAELLLLKDIKEDFSNSIGSYLKSLCLIDRIHGEYNVSAGIWGSGPAYGLKALIYEYLRSRDVKVIGAQHGALYGDSYMPLHFDSDFNRCGYYISYGFTGEDLSRTYSKPRLDIEVLPFGKALNKHRPQAKRKIDLLFPLTNSVSIFYGGILRTPPHILAERQTRLLKYLDSLKGYEIYAKPFPSADGNACAVLPLLRKAKNLKVIYDLSLIDFLKEYDPGAVLIELYSTPLLETLHLDAEIFLMNDPIYPFEARALSEVKKRVYYSSDIDETIGNMDLFFKGKLQKKRDDTFYNHYVYKDGTSEKITSFIEGIVWGHKR